MNAADDRRPLGGWMQRGRAVSRQGRLDEALGIFAEATRRFPFEPQPAFAHCLAALQAADPRAAALLQDLLTRFPAHAAGWEDLGMWLLEAGKVEAALVCLRRAMAAAPDARLALACGGALRSLGRLAEARRAYADAGRLAPTSARAAFLLGLCAQDLRDYPAARVEYERALSIDPSLPEAWVNLGTVLQEMGDLEGARRAYGVALRRRADTFGRISQALTASPRGELWLDLGRLRRDLTG